jgi:hypothetical protein
VTLALATRHAHATTTETVNFGVILDTSFTSTDSPKTGVDAPQAQGQPHRKFREKKGTRQKKNTERTSGINVD